MFALLHQAMNFGVFTTQQYSLVGHMITECMLTLRTYTSIFQ